MIDRPAQIFFGSFFLAILTRLVLIEVFYRVYHHGPAKRVRAFLVRVVRPPAEGAYIGPGGESTFIGNLLLIFLFFWPFAAFGVVALLAQPTLTLAIWLALILRDLLSGGIFLDYDKPIRVNFGYNLGYMWIHVVGIMVGLAFFVSYAALSSVPGVVEVVSVELVAALALLVAMHVVEVMYRLDKTNVGHPSSQRNDTTH